MTAERWQLFHAWLFACVSWSLVGALWNSFFPSAPALLTIAVSSVSLGLSLRLFYRLGREPAWLREALA